MRTLLSMICILSLTVAMGQETNGGKRLYARSILNQKAPGLVVQEWLTKVPDTRGKFVLLDFSATWCHACRKSMPELNDFQKKFADKLVVIFVTKETPEKVREAKNFLVEVASAVDTANRTYKSLAIKGIPHNILVDPKGYVRWEGFPAIRDYELTEAVLLSVFEKYSDGPHSGAGAHEVKVLPEPALAGPVKTVTEVEFAPQGKPGAVAKGPVLGKRVSHYNTAGQLVGERYYKAGDTLVNHAATSYDSRGLLTERSCYSPDERVFTRTVFTYDGQGRAVEETVYDAGGRVDVKAGYRYDRKGRLSEETLQDAGGALVYRSVYRYDRGGQLAEKTIYQPGGSVSSRYAATYKKGRPVAVTVSGPAGMVNKYAYRYDGQGNQVEGRVFGADGRLSSVYTYRYDARNQKIEERVTYPDGRLVIRYAYRYDDQGRLAETYRYDPGGELYLQSQYRNEPSASQVVWDYYNQGKPSTQYINRYEQIDKMGNWLRRVKSANNRLVGYSERQVEYHQQVAAAGNK